MPEFTSLKDGWTLAEDNSATRRLTLIRPDGVSLTVDFTGGKTRHRTSESGHGAQALSKALGIKAFRNKHDRFPHVIDATGGLGQDAWAIASTGCTVTIIEKHPTIHALLNDGLSRARNDMHSSAIAHRMTLREGDACTLLPTQCTDTTHAIYLDPMYPERRKKANSKKGMQFLQALLDTPSTQDSALLLEALQCDVNRVAVKRPRGAPELPGTDQFSGQLTTINTPNTRYDVYHLNRGSQSRKF